MFLETHLFSISFWVLSVFAGVHFEKHNDDAFSDFCPFSLKAAFYAAPLPAETPALLEVDAISYYYVQPPLPAPAQ